MSLSDFVITIPKKGCGAYDKTFLSIRPYSNMTYKLSDKFSFSLTAIGEESMPTALSLMAQKHLVDYRTSISNPGHEEAVMNSVFEICD